MPMPGDVAVVEDVPLPGEPELELLVPWCLRDELLAEAAFFEPADGPFLR
jgi:hypothetical protein